MRNCRKRCVKKGLTDLPVPPLSAVADALPALAAVVLSAEVAAVGEAQLVVLRAGASLQGNEVFAPDGGVTEPGPLFAATHSFCTLPFVVRAEGLAVLGADFVVVRVAADFFTKSALHAVAHSFDACAFRVLRSDVVAVSLASLMVVGSGRSSDWDDVLAPNRRLTAAMNSFPLLQTAVADPFQAVPPVKSLP